MKPRTAEALAYAVTVAGMEQVRTASVVSTCTLAPVEKAP